MWVSRGIELYPQNGGQAAVVDAWAVHGIWWIWTRNEYRLRARPTDDVDPSATDRFLKKLLLLSSFLLFLVFFSSAPSLRCSFRFSSAL